MPLTGTDRLELTTFSLPVRCPEPQPRDDPDPEQ